MGCEVVVRASYGRNLFLSGCTLRTSLATQIGSRNVWSSCVHACLKSKRRTIFQNLSPHTQHSSPKSWQQCALPLSDSGLQREGSPSSLTAFSEWSRHEQLSVGCVNAQS